jgi:hypothetical protein
VLVNDVQELETAAIGYGIKLEIHGPDLVGMFGPMSPHRAVRGPGPLALPKGGPLQAFFPPKPLHSLVIDGPAFPLEQTVGHPAAPADVLSGDLPKALSELGLLQVDDLGRMALGAAVLTTRQAWRSDAR